MRDRAAIHALISGSVQGVGFRYAASREATRLGIVGWVRNRGDGCVEILAEGEPGVVTEFQEWLGEGPPGAYVTNVSVESRAPTGRFSGFSIEI
jgi:acylphosphatase